VGQRRMTGPGLTLARGVGQHGADADPSLEPLVSVAAEVAAWLGPGRDATLMSYLLPADTPPAAIRAALARAAADEPPGPRPAVVARRDALLALGADEAGEARALDEVLAAEPRFRALAAWALGRRATAAAVAALGAAIAHDPDPVARQAALRALGAAGAAAAELAATVAALAEAEAEPPALRALARRVAERLGPAAEAGAATSAEPAAEAGTATSAEPAAEAGTATSAEPEPEPPAASEDDDNPDDPAPPTDPVDAGPPMAFGAGLAAAPEDEPPPDDPLLAALVAIRPGFTGPKLRARVVHALALQGFAIDADVAIPDRGDGRPGAIDIVATRGNEVLALVFGDELPAYPALLALGQVQATARGVVLGAAGLTHVPEFADWLVAGGRWRRKT